MASTPLRRFWLCADDYGLSPGVSAAIRDLVARGRLNATSAMVVAPGFGAAEAQALSALKRTAPRLAIGLHFTLTAPFAPLSPGYAPLRDGTFLPLRATLTAAMLGRLQPEAIGRELRAQIAAFVQAFGFPPDFIDGHQHVHIFPQVRDAIIAVARDSLPAAWLRQCEGRTLRLSNPKAWLLDALSRGFRRRAQAAGIAVNPAFDGSYRFAADADYARLFPDFLDRLPDGGLVMCHPGFVDDELRRLDPLTDLRAREYAFFAGDAFPAILSQRGFTLS